MQGTAAKLLLTKNRELHNNQIKYLQLSMADSSSRCSARPAQNRTWPWEGHSRGRRRDPSEPKTASHRTSDPKQNIIPS
jgi:hypothetical protein